MQIPSFVRLNSFHRINKVSCTSSSQQKNFHRLSNSGRFEETRQSFCKNNDEGKSSG